MLGKLVGKALSLPVKVANLPVKAVNRSLEWMTGNEDDNNPVEETLDKLADGIEDVCEDALD